MAIVAIIVSLYVISGGLITFSKYEKLRKERALAYECIGSMALLLSGFMTLIMIFSII